MLFELLLGTLCKFVFQLLEVILALYLPLVFIVVNGQFLLQIGDQFFVSCLGLNISNSQLQLILSYQLQANVFFRKSLALFDKFYRFIIWEIPIVFIPLNNSYSSLAFQGGYPNIIQQKIIPIDQISHFVEYCVLYRIWGAMQIGLPTQDLSIWEPKLSTYLANPKSPILQTPSLIKMLAGLRSRWIIFSFTNSTKPLTICLITQNTSSYLNLFLLINYFRSPFLQYQVIMQRLFLELRTSLNLTILT